MGTVPVAARKLVMTLAYTVRTGSGGRGKNSVGWESGIPDTYITFHFGAKFTILGQPTECTSENLD